MSALQAATNIRNCVAVKLSYTNVVVKEHEMLAPKGKIQHSIKRIRFQDINENLVPLRAGNIIGRAVIVFDGVDNGCIAA